MHGLNTYDYGARQHDPILCRWDRIDPLCEKYYNVSPYNYCHNNPIIMIDPNGMDDYYTSDGVFLGTNNKKTDYIYISSRKMADMLFIRESDYRNQIFPQKLCQKYSLMS